MQTIILQMSNVVAALSVEIVSLFGFVLMIRLYRQEGKQRVHLYAALYYFTYFLSWLLSLVGQIAAAHGYIDLGVSLTKIVYQGGLICGPFLFAMAVEAYAKRYKNLQIGAVVAAMIPLAIYAFLVPTERSDWTFINGVIYPASSSWQVILLSMPYIISQLSLLVYALVSYRRTRNWSDIYNAYAGLAILGTVFWSGMVVFTGFSGMMALLIAHASSATACFVVGMIGVRHPNEKIKRNPLLYIRSSIELRTQVYGAAILLICIFAIAVASATMTVSITNRHNRELQNALIMQEVARYENTFTEVMIEAERLNGFMRGIEPADRSAQLQNWVDESNLSVAIVADQGLSVISSSVTDAIGQFDTSRILNAGLERDEMPVWLQNIPNAGWFVCAAIEQAGNKIVVARLLSDKEYDGTMESVRYNLGLLSWLGVSVDFKNNRYVQDETYNYMVAETRRNDGYVSGTLSDGSYFCSAEIVSSNNAVVGYVYLIEDRHMREAETLYIGAILVEISLAIGVFIFLLLRIFSRSTVRPITALAKAAAEVEGGKYDLKLGSDSPDELGQAIRAFDQMAKSLGLRTAELEEKMREQRDLLNYVAHEMKTPVTAMRWALEMIGDMPEMTANGRQVVGEAEIANDRLKDLINDLLELSRLERGILAVNLESFNLNVVIEQVLRELANVQRHGNIAIDWNIDQPDLPPVWADRKRVVQILTNLIGNAIKYSDPGDRVHVSISRADRLSPRGTAGDYLCVKVQDWGIGIPPDQQDKIFSRFYRASNAVESDREGTGLGLHLSRQMIQMQGGDIWFTSAIGEGSTFSMTLPLATSKPIESEKSSEK
ncbi:MAG: HAMP domain-containing sensor histidine kinase [Patescibacteria group bacterium]